MNKNEDFQIYFDFNRQIQFHDPSIKKLKLVHSRILKLSVPEADFSYEIIGKALYASEKFQKFIFPFKKATIVNPQNTTAHICLGDSFLKLGKKDECFSSLKKALSILPKETKLHHFLIKILKDLNRLGDLPSLYQETAEMMKNKEYVLDLYFHSAETLEELYVIPQALEQYKKPLRLVL